MSPLQLTFYCAFLLSFLFWGESRGKLIGKSKSSTAQSSLFDPPASGNSKEKPSSIPKPLENVNSFMNRHGHKVVGYEERKRGKERKSRKNAKELGNRLVGRDYWLAGLGFLGDGNFVGMGGASLSSDDEEQGIQGLLLLSHMRETDMSFSLANFNSGNSGFFSLDKSSYGIHGTVRAYDRSFFLEPFLTSVNFLQVGAGYQQHKIELHQGPSDTYSSPSGELEHLAFDIVQSWGQSNSTKNSIALDRKNVYNLNLAIGSELGMKYFSLLPYLRYDAFFGDVEFSSFSYGLDLSLFYSNSFITFGVSDGTKALTLYLCTFGYFF